MYSSRKWNLNGFRLDDSFVIKFGLVSSSIGKVIIFGGSGFFDL